VEPVTRTPPRWAEALYRTAWRLLGEAGPGRGVPLDAVIDLHKAATGPAVLALMAALDVYTPAAWVYLALHGSYGVAWVLKDRTLPDRRWRRRVPWTGALVAFAFLSHYWVAPALLVLGTAGALELDGWDPAGWPALAVAVAVYAVGLALMMGADAQKNALLGAGRTGPAGARTDTGAPAETAGAAEAGGPGAAVAAGPGPGLITGGFYARVRHPNYLGEMLVYGAFALVVDHWVPWAILAAVWVLVFLPGMLAIEASLSRYPGYEAWRSRTGFLLPRPWRR
jgi:steroid 5-alpha reductase family enzyme